MKTEELWKNVSTNFKSVIDLREKIETASDSFKKEPGVYRLWVKEGPSLDILKGLDCQNMADKLLQKNIQGTDFLAMYFGMSKNTFGRLKWHMLQKHNAKTVKNGTISTLRHTLSAILFKGKGLTSTKDKLDKWMDENCFFEWGYTPDKSRAADIEKDEISRNIYPLNIQGNKRISKDLRNQLIDLRKKVNF